MSISIASILLSALLAPATLPTTAPVADGRVDALLDRLAAADAATRDGAQRELLSLPDDALLDRLKTARVAANDPDLQLRLDTLLVQVQERADVGGSRVTLKFVNAPLNTVLDSFAAQTHTHFIDQSGQLLLGNNGSDSPQTVTLDLANVSFWRAAQEIEDKTELVFQPGPDGWGINRSQGQPSFVHGADAGAFVVVPFNANYSRTVAYMRNMGGGNENFTVFFQVLPEPKIKLASGIGRLDLDRAVDSNGNDLLGGSGQRSQQINTGQGQNSIGCNIQLKFPKNPGAQISEISGTMRVSIARRVETLSSDDVMGKDKAELQLDGTTVTVEPYTGKDNPQQARNIGGNGNEPAPVDLLVTISTPPGGADVNVAARMQQNLQQRLRITDDRGVMMRLTSFAAIRGDATRTEIRVTYLPMQPQNSRGPYKMRLEIPTSFRDVDVPFAMRDLKMP